VFQNFRLPRRIRVISSLEKKTIDVEGISTGYLTAGAGAGPPLVLLHGVGTSASEWTWVLPALARNHLVYAIDLPGYDGSAEPPDYSPAFTARFVGAFLDAVGVDSAVVVASSFGGLVALRLALSEPTRVSALVLVDSAGLDRAVSPALAALTLPKGSELMAAWNRTPAGAAHRVFTRAFLLFARPWQIPIEWLTGQYKVAQLPNFTRTELEALRTTINMAGQREVLLDQLPHLKMPTLIVWGTEDRVFPYWQAKDAAARLQNGSLKLIPNCGHLPHVEQPKQFISILSGFLGALR
jgi:4,5:9,10-diseco-3-hydroxy-5,9,17-trioxoandrosta-1(10),2-diene-4-oate hydrolase